MRHLTTDESPRLPGCSQVVAGQCFSSPQQGWVGDPGWAPMSRRRSLAPRTFLCLPTWSLSSGLQHYLIPFLWYCTFLRFYRFYNFFWAVVVSTKLCMQIADFYNFFQMLAAHFPLCDYPFVLFLSMVSPFPVWTWKCQFLQCIRLNWPLLLGLSTPYWSFLAVGSQCVLTFQTWLRAATVI